jgi:hypothetical protein
VVAGVLALTAIFAYVLDAAGFGLMPVTTVLLAVAVTAPTAWRTLRLRPAGAIDSAIWIGVVLFVLAAIIRIGWPSLVPPGRGPDLTHHLLLVDYIEQHGQLVHDRSLDGSMGEMAHYTPGAHLLAVIAGSLFGGDGLRAFFPLLALCASLTAGFVYLVARRCQVTVPYAVIAVIVLFLPSQYFYGAFTHDGFLAQTIATFFAVAAWWALTAWEQERTALHASMFSMFLVATFLTWPVFIGPLILVFLFLAAGANNRARDAAIALTPIAVVAALHISGRWGWIAIVRTSGAVLQPSLESFGWLLPALTLVGVCLGIANRSVRTGIVFLFTIVAQAAALFAIAATQGADTPYMAFKMAYLAIYPMAVLAAFGISRAARVAGSRDAAFGWAIATLLVLIAVRPALTTPRPVPVVDLDLYEAGRWTRANVGQTCVDYLVGDAQTAYWLHLAVLGNPRSSARMEEIDVYDPRAALGRWITAESRGYAIADARQLPDEVRSRVEIVRTFGNSLVLRRPGAATCYDGGL